MKQADRQILYHLLPAVSWLLAAGGIAFWAFSDLASPFSVWDLMPAVLVLAAGTVIRRVKRHENVEEPAFLAAVLTGIAAYWLPSVLFLMLPAWGYMIYRNLFSLRVLLASLIGWAVVAVWLAVLSFFSVIAFSFSIASNLILWIPTGSVLVAWIVSAVARYMFEVR